MTRPGALWLALATWLSMCTLVALPQASAAACIPSGESGWASVLDTRSASVVEIRTLRLGRTLGEGDFEPELQPDADFDERLSWPVPASMVLSEQRDLASGIIVGSDGLIMSSAHVVSNVDEIRVTLFDGRRFNGRLIGSDAQMDVALVKIEARGLPVASMGDSSLLRPGDEVAAIGSPFGFGGSLTSGVVSAVDRFIPGAGDAPFIQTDVVINPGSSGSPLFNRCGEVVAINSLIYSGDGAYMGIAFAVPSNVALRALAQLRREGAIHRVWLGAQLQALTPALAASFGLNQANGVLVAKVEPASPAAAAGLSIGDVLLALDDQAVTSLPELLRQIAAGRPGNVSRLTVWRRAQSRTLRVTWAQEPDKARRLLPAPPVSNEGFDGLGLRLAELTPAAQRQLRADGGLLVRESSGAARSEGLRAGDVVVAVNDQRMTRVEDFRAAIQKLPRDRPVALLIVRDRRLIYVPVSASLAP